MRYKYFNIIFLCLVLVMSRILTVDGIEKIQSMVNGKSDEIIVAVDPGHGGFDPGKIGVNKAVEKEINLSIALKLKKVLEENNIKVVMTREEDKALHGKYETNRKRVDMWNRVNLINESNATLAVSIHQNSYTSESVRGAQVFYYSNSEKGKVLAEILQQVLKDNLDKNSKMKAKANKSYYMLRNTKCPLVIVECGFLSNWRDAKLLVNEEYQQKIAEGICEGILKYIEELKE